MPAQRRTEITPAEALAGTLDFEALARGIPRSFVVKGLFFEKLRQRLGAEWTATEGILEEPPRLGRYVPFSDYPRSDYLRLAAAVVKLKHPDVSPREGLRLVARDDFETFAASTLGRVVLAAAGDAKSAMLAMESVYTRMAAGDWSLSVTEQPAGAIWIEFKHHPDAWEYQLGQTEGLVQSFKKRPHIVVDELAPGNVRFDVRYD